MTNYTSNQLVDYSTEDIYKAQANEDEANRQKIEEKLAENNILNPQEKIHLLEYYTDTMEKYRLIYNAFVQAFSTGYMPGYPKNIYNIDLSDGSIETDKDGRRICYTMKVLAPCSTSAVQYIHNDCGRVYIIFPPIKSAERTLEKIIDERTREHEELIAKELKKAEDLSFSEEEPELPFFKVSDKDNTVSLAIDANCPLVNDTHDRSSFYPKNTLTNIAKDDLLPKDIYRLSILAKYRGNLEMLINELEEKFPSYIKFEDGENNQYKKKLSENKRNYFDIKRTARIAIPGSDRCFYVEFQFKQTNMFYAHIRSHRAYEDYRVLAAKYQKLEESANKKGNANTAKIKADLSALAKKRDEKLKLCESIHTNALRQSNFYLMQELSWLDDNARSMGHPADERGHYNHSVHLLKDNYIVESYDPFDGLTAYSTNDKEYLNKNFFLKMIGKLPESFDELGKNAEEHVKKIWNTLAPADVDKFKNITNTAIRYQDIIRKLQKEKQTRDSQSINKEILNMAIIQSINQNAL